MNNLDYLFFRRRQELLRAETARCPQARTAHQALAELFGDRILAARTGHGEGLTIAPRSGTSRAVIAQWALKH